MFNLFNNAPGVSGAKDVLPAGATLPSTAFPNGQPTPDGCSDYLPTTFTGPCAVQFRSTAGNKTHERIYAGRFDYNFGSKDRMFIHYQQDHGLQASYTDPITPLFNIQSVQPEFQGQLSESHTFGATAVNQLILFGQWYSALFENKNQAATLAAYPTTLLMGDGSLGGLTPGLGNSLGGENFIFPQGRNVTQYGFSDDFSWTKGPHTFKFGAKFRRNDIGDHDYGAYAIGLLIPFSLADFAAGGNGPEGDELVQNFPRSLDLPMATWNMGIYGQDAWKVRPNLTLNLALRIEHDSNPVCQYNCFARLNAPWNELSHDASVPYNQILLDHQHQALSGMQGIAWEPRVGFAWQPRGISRNTVLRGGVGIFGDAFPGTVADYFSENSPQYNAFTAYFDNMSPAETSNLFADTSGSNQTFNSGYASGQTVSQMLAENSTFAPPSLTVSDKKTHVPTYEKWSLELQQGLGQHSTFSLSYEGNHGYHEYVSNGALNAYEDGFSGLPATAPDPRFGTVAWITSAGTSSYNGLTASFKEQIRSLAVQINYTWSHAMDTVSNAGVLQFSYATNASPLDPTNPYDIRSNRGDSDYDVRHYLNANYVWQIPIKTLTHGHGPNGLVNGWQASGTLFARTGLPFTPYDYDDGLAIMNYGAAQLYANFNGGPVGSCSGPKSPCLLSTQFSPSTTGFGNIGRNSFRGPRYFDTDFDLLKYTNIPGWESAKLAIGVQAFNVLNHPNFDNPMANISDSHFGEVERAIGPPTSLLGAFLGGDASPRMLQLTLRLVF